MSEKDIADIEKVINARGITEAVVSAAEGKIKILRVEKKKVS